MTSRLWTSNLLPYDLSQKLWDERPTSKWGFPPSIAHLTCRAGQQHAREACTHACLQVAHKGGQQRGSEAAPEVTCRERLSVQAQDEESCCHWRQAERHPRQEAEEAARCCAWHALKPTYFHVLIGQHLCKIVPCTAWSDGEEDEKSEEEPESEEEEDEPLAKRQKKAAQPKKKAAAAKGPAGKRQRLKVVLGMLMVSQHAPVPAGSRPVTLCPACPVQDKAFVDGGLDPASDSEDDMPLVARAKAMA